MPASQELHPTRPRVRARLRLWLLLLAPLGGLLLVEAGLRVAHGLGRLDGWLYMPGAQTEFSTVPTLQDLLAKHQEVYPPLTRTVDFTLTKKSLRTPDYAVEKEPGTLRIVALGDSHTWRSGGMPFPSLWHRQLQRRLANSSRTKVEMISLGIPAVGPDFELRMWELEGRKLSADVVVLAVSVGNDFLECLGQLADESRLDRWSRNCLTLRFGRNFLRWRATQGITPFDPAGTEAPSGGQGGVYHPEVEVNYDRQRPRFSVEAHQRIMYRRLANARHTRKRLFDRATLRMRTVLDALHADVQRQCAKLALLLIPDEYQLDPELYSRLVEESGQPPNQFEIDRPQRVLKEYCANRSILCVDPLPALRAAAAWQPLFRPQEGHLNDFGHAILGEALEGALLDAGLVP